MSRVIFDIETVGTELNKLDKRLQEEVLARASDANDPQAIRLELSLSPLTGSVIAIGMLNPDTLKGAVYFQSPHQSISPYTQEGIYYETGTEEQILKKFWRDITNYKQFITFNGRSFDCPYIHIRSAIHKIKPSRNLMPYRYDATTHCDLKDQFTFYGAKRVGSLHAFCKAFGISSSKEGAIEGSNITQAYKDKMYKEIAQYCAKDLFVTAELFKRWENYVKV